MIQVDVNLGERSYPIYIEKAGLGKIARLLQSHKMSEKTFIITDTNVGALYGETVKKNLGDQVFMVQVPAGELSKSLEQCRKLYTILLEQKISRKSTVIAMGGGVVGDLGGFIASTILRGVRFIQIPTTVLAQVDSSVGGKVGVNHPLGKNLIGAFYQPEFVLIDLHVLSTLPEREIRAGFAEVVKYGFIKSKSLYNRLHEKAEILMSLRDWNELEEVIAECCRIKADIVEKDEREQGLRALLNFGHTIGHALEAATEYKYFLHGEALCHGMRAALHLSRLAGTLSDDDVLQPEKLLRVLRAPDIPGYIEPETILRLMLHDKKRDRAGQLWVLLNRIGDAFSTRVVENKWVNETINYILDRDKNYE